MLTDKPTTGPYSQKRYGCTHCGDVEMTGTNHWGEIYSRCRACSWRRPGQATVKVCLDPMPEGYAEPAPWKLVRLGDVANIVSIKLP